MMRAIRTTPTAIIQQIRHNLQDNYASGFPILKELLQNADDAGAETLSIAVIDGLHATGEESPHPLVAGPALLVLNDGSFLPEDADKLALMGEGNKGNKLPSIGKFGLVLKSILHLCESFFYLAHPQAPGKPIRREFINVWADTSQHPEWTDISDVDVESMHARLRPMLPQQRDWLCLWIPLRRQSHVGRSMRLSAEFPGDMFFENSTGDDRQPINPLERIFDSQYDVRTASVLPLMKHLHRVHSWTMNTEGTLRFDRSVELRSKSLRTTIKDRKGPFIGDLVGGVSIQRSDMKVGASPDSVGYVGVEQWLDDPSIHEVRNSGAWPKQTWTNPTTGEEEVEDEKGIPHVAAYWVARRASQPAKVRVIPTVFLPLGDDAVIQNDYSGTSAFDLVLHGYFFVDAGRRGIDYGEGSDGKAGTTYDGGARDEQAVRRRWNQLLRDRGVLPLILPALNRLAEKLGRDSTPLDDLMESLSPARADGRTNPGAIAHYLRQHQDSLHREFQWIKRLGSSGSRWELVKADERVCSLPRPQSPSDGGGNVQPTEVLPGLRGLLDDLAITADTRCLCRKPPEPLPPTALSRLLSQQNGFDAGAAFSCPNRAGYLVDVIDHVQRGRPTSDELEAMLVRTARVAIQGGIPGANSPLIAPLRRLIAAISPESRLKLSCRGTLRAEILALDLKVLIVPVALEPEGSGSASAALLSSEDAVQLLRTLGSLGEAVGTSLTSMACQVLDACDDATREAALRACRSVRLFSATDVTTEVSSPYSCEDLQDALASGLVFSSSKEERLIAGRLQEALQDEHVLLVEERVSNVLFTERLPGGAAQCARALSLRPHLKDADNRLNLLDYLLKNSSQSSQVTWAREDVQALRYLLHGRVDAYDDLEPLYQPAGRGPWANLLKLALRLEDQHWRVIPDQLAARLNALEESRLILWRVDAESVSQYLAAQWKRLGDARDDHDENIDPSFWSQLRLDEFSDPELATIFAEFPIDGDDVQIVTLRLLPLHLTIRGTRASIGRLGYLEDPSRSFELDEELRAKIVIFQCDSDPVRRLKQERLFGERRLTSATIVRLAAAEQEVPVHWSTLLCALSEVDRHPDLETLRLKSWVPTRTGFVAPIDVPYLPNLDLRQEFPDVQLTCEADLLPEFCGHRHFAAGRKLLPKVDETLNYLGQQLSSHDHYLLGPAEVAEVPLAEILQVFEGDGECMPCLPLLNRLVEHTSVDTCQRHLVRHLLKPIQAVERWIAILSHLAELNENDHNRAGTRKLFDLYLSGANRHPSFGSQILPRIQLLSATRRWRPSSELCVDWPGVSSSYLLHPEHAAILGFDARTRNAPTSAWDSTNVSVASPSLIDEADRSAAILKQYFSRWSSAPPGAVAGFLSLLGNLPNLTGYVEELVQPRRISSIRDVFPWQVPPRNIGGGGYSMDESMQRCRILVRLDKSRTIRALNLFGGSFDAPASDSPSHLLMGDPEPVLDHSLRAVQDGQGNQYYRIVLRDVETVELTPTQASELLRESAQLVLHRVYWQWASDLQNVWQTLTAADQLDITVTQQILLDRAPGNLSKLRTDKIPSLRKPLQFLDEAFHCLAQAQQSVAGLRKDRLRDAEQALAAAKQKLGELLTQDEAVQAEVVEALRGKVCECGYNVSSIPFELLQNADDASVEYYEMFGGNEQTRPDGTRFVVSCEANRLRFMHWGRPINKYRHNQFDGSDRGFRRDLSKMLALGESDKLSGVEPKNTTGRFGLGFKSVFLISDRPRIVSGWLAFEVVAGIYPKRLEAAETERLRQVLHGRGPADGTLVELELTAATSLVAESGPLFRFLNLVHLLVICTRQVHRLELDVNGHQRTIDWNPTAVCGLANVRLGRVRPWNDAVPACYVLVLGQGRGSLLLRLEGRGLTAFDADVPTIWATAPTIHTDDFGIAVNGDFELDPGRTQLLGESPENRSRAAALGRAVGEQLVQLFDISGQDWVEFQSALHLEPDVTPELFWHSTFALMTDRFSRKSGRSRVLLNEVLWENADRGMHRLVHERRVVPNALPSPYAALVRVADIQFTISTSLLEGDGSVFSKIAGWPSFQRHVIPGACVAQDVLRTLANLAVAVPQTQLLGPMEIIRFEVEGTRVDAASARRLMTVLRTQLVEAAVMDLRQGRSSRLGEFLRDVELVGCDGRWHSVRELLIPAAEEDEARREAFAPAAAVLAPEYRDDALEFVRYCRALNGGRMRIGVPELCRWARDADEESTQLAVLKYLVDGQLPGLGDALREQIADDPAVWLADLNEGTLLRRAFPDDVNRQQLVLARLGLVRTFGWVAAPAVEEEEVIPAPLADPGEVLRRIAAAWRNGAGRRDYESKIYAGDRSPKCSLENLATDLEVRKEWMRLLMAGSLHTMGMSQIPEYGNFVSLCKQRGWLDDFSDPQIDPRRWMKVLDEFLDPGVRHMKYHRDMQRFICFYQFARYLRDYAYCFSDMNHVQETSTLSQVLRSRENSLQAGGGADAPPLTQALGIGACFVIRELVYGGFIHNAAAHRYCFVPVRPVVRLLIGMGCSELMDRALERWELSAVIYEFLCRHLGPEGATFGGDFDLPLQAAVDGSFSAYGLSDDCERFVRAGREESEA